MIKASPTIFKFYITMMESFSEYLSKKYSDSSLDNPDHYKTIIIQKIIRMFHTLDELTKVSKDEVSARCVLRGILDGVTTYCFIYQRDNQSDIMFRHYLYALDGFTTYKNAIVDGISEEGVNKPQFENSYHDVINQLKQKLFTHPYNDIDNKNVEAIINNNNWKYESLDKPKGLTFQRLYKKVGFDAKLVRYYQEILSQYAHGLCLSNTQYINDEQLQKVLFESIPLANRMVQGIYNTFPPKEMLEYFRHSDSYKKIINYQDFNHDDLMDFTKALTRKDRILYF